MAGAGYKLFNTGDVLTAAQVNTYLQEQTVMVFADAAARTTALSGVLAEGMVSYLKSTDAVEVYNGSAWVGIAADQTPLTTKGDLFTYSTTDARLAVGNNGETLVADSSTSTGLRWGDNLGYTAGKNFVINGNMNISQRGTSFASLSTGETYTIDRFACRINTLGVWTVSRETDAPAGFGSSMKWLVTTADNAPAAGDFGVLRHKMEGQALQGLMKGTASSKTTTVSFWVKSNVTGNYVANINDPANIRSIRSLYTINAADTWEKKTLTFVGDTSGTIVNDSAQALWLEWWLGAGSNFTSGTLNTTWASTVTANQAVGQTNVAATLNNYWMITGVQWEIGSVATQFQLSAGTLAGELAACQRYFQVIGGNTAGENMGAGMAYSTTNSVIHTTFQVPFRTAPSIALGTGGAAGDFRVYNSSATELTVTSILTYTALTSYSMRVIPVVASGLTAGNATIMLSANSNGKLFASAEL